MMKLNLNFYKGEDKYTDGDIEDQILSYIKKYPEDYEKAFEKDKSWPVVYHLSSIRNNVINWYPFNKDASILEVGAGMGAITSELCKKCKSVTSIELSKKRATAILERNKNAKNLEIIVGNFEDIELEKKFDYVLLNGVLEYGALYIQSEQPYVDFITKIKKYLKKNGKILIAIENRFGIKYWCGATEDHTNRMFDGLNDYPNNKSIKTFSKKELEELAETCKMDINFYYMFPDYKFPELIYTDKSLAKGVFCDYGPYYCDIMTTFIDERKIYNQIYKDSVIPFFANSYFVELGEKLDDVQVEFVKYNNYRNKKYRFFAYLQDNKFYKKAMSDECKNHLECIYKNYTLLKANKVNILSIEKQDDKVYSEICNENSLTCLLDKYVKNNQDEKIIDIYEKLFQYLKMHSGKKVNTKNTIFNKYNIEVGEAEFEYYECGIIDAIPNNIFIKGDKFILFDQEWIEKNTPIEFVIYRAINEYFKYSKKDNRIVTELYKRFNIKNYISLFKKLDESFAREITKDGNQYFDQYYINYNFIPNVNQRMFDMDVLKAQNNEVRDTNGRLVLENKELTERLNGIYNSKGYKILNSFYRMKNKFSKKKVSSK